MDGLFLPAPPRLSRADLLAKLVRANEVFPEKEEGLMKYAEQVPLGLILPARDLMRGPGQQHFDRPGDAWTGLSNDIAERGILSPIFLEWSTADGYAYAGEGNTRLAVAQELGLPTVPVVVYRKSLPLQGQSRGGEIGPFEFNKRQYLLDQGMTEDMPSWEFKMEDGYVPQYFQPHYLIGFLDQRTSGRLDLPDKYRDEDEWHPYNPTMYHVAPASVRDDILRDGLIGWEDYDVEDPNETGVYAWPTMGSARNCVRDYESIREIPHDIWAIRGDHGWRPDPITSGVYSPLEVIDPEYLELVQPADWQEA